MPLRGQNEGCEEMTPKRIQRLQRKKAYRGFYAYVGPESEWQNPFPFNSDGVIRTHDEVARLYRRWIEGDIVLPGKPPPTVEYIREMLSGKHLGCCCSVKRACHADVLLEIANADDED